MGGSLADTLPRARYAEWHARAIDAPAAAVWAALLAVSWQDLVVGGALMRVRGLDGARTRAPFVDLFRGLGTTVEAPPHTLTQAMVGRPWVVSAPARPMTDLDAVRTFREPGWLKYGMEWRLHELDEHRTFVETVTLCEPTDERARRRFALYWGMIRIGSSIIRHDLLRAIERRALTSLSASRP